VYSCCSLSVRAMCPDFAGGCFTTWSGSAQVQLGVRVLSMAEGVAAVPWSQQEVVEVMRVRQVSSTRSGGRLRHPLQLRVHRTLTVQHLHEAGVP
jgi:hypothetical protein